MLFLVDDTPRGQLLDLAHGTIVRQYATGLTHRYATTFCPFVQHIAVFQRNSCATLLSPCSSHVLQRSFTGEVVSCCVASPCGTLMFAGTVQGSLLVWNTRSGELLRNCKVHLRAVTCLALSSDAALLVTASEDAECKTWSVAALCAFGRIEVTTVCTYTGHTLAVHCCTFLHHTPYVVTGSADKTCRLYDAVTASELRRFVVGDEVTAVAVCAEDARLVAGTRAGALYFAALSVCPPRGSETYDDDPHLTKRGQEPLLCKPHSDGHHSPIILLHYGRHNVVLTVSENGAVLWYDAVDGSLRHEYCVGRKVRIISCCLLPTRVTVTNVASRRIGLSKNPVDSCNGFYALCSSHHVSCGRRVSCTRVSDAMEDVKTQAEALRRENDELDGLRSKLERRLKKARCA